MRVTNAQTVTLLGIAGFALGCGDTSTAMMAAVLIWIAKGERTP